MGGQVGECCSNGRHSKRFIRLRVGEWVIHNVPVPVVRVAMQATCTLSPFVLLEESTLPSGSLEAALAFGLFRLWISCYLYVR
jgi:hypothetical protein